MQLVNNFTLYVPISRFCSSWFWFCPSVIWTRYTRFDRTNFSPVDISISARPPTRSTIWYKPLFYNFDDDFSILCFFFRYLFVLLSLADQFVMVFKLINLYHLLLYTRIPHRLVLFSRIYIITCLPIVCDPSNFFFTTFNICRIFVAIFFFCELDSSFMISICVCLLIYV